MELAAFASAIVTQVTPRDALLMVASGRARWTETHLLKRILPARGLEMGLFVYLVLVLGAGCPLTKNHPDVPRIAPEVTMRAGQMEVALRYCDEAGLEPQ